MPRLSKDQREATVHDEALTEFDEIQLAHRGERLQCLEDRRFYSIPGAQWAGAFGEQFENKPHLEVNKIHLSVIRIFNEYRNNRIDVSFESKDGATDETLADTCASLFRADEQDSGAEEAYDNAFDEAVGGGFGALRLVARYEDENAEEGEDDADEARPQRIRIEPICDADSSVFFDLNAKRQDKNDARSCFVVTSMTRAAYKRIYDDDPENWPKSIHLHEFDWYTANVVYIAEYYRVEDVGETFVTFEGLTGEQVEHTKSELEDDEDLARELEVTGFREIARRKTRVRRIHKFILNGSRVLEDCGFIAGRQIPVVPVYGKRWFVDNVERCMGHVRLAKDCQRIKNAEISMLAEIASCAPVEKPILTPEQIHGHERTWAEDNIKNYPYRLINKIEDATGQQVAAGPVGKTSPPSVPQALAALLELTERDMQEILGNPQEAEKMISHVAGKTVEAIQQRIDGNSFIYISNMAKALRRCGEIWLSMAKELYTDKGRKMKGVDVRGGKTQIELMKNVIGPDQKPMVANDLSRASFDVAVTIGPTSDSKRQAAVRATTNMMAVVQDQEMQSVLGLIVLANMEGEGVEDARAWARQKLVKMGVFKPTPEEAKQLAAAAQGQQPSPADQLTLAAAKESAAKAQQALAESALTAARTDETKARTIKTLADVDLDREQAKVDAAKSVHELSTASLDQALRAKEMHHG